MIKPRHQVSPAALDMIKRFEGYERRAVQLPDGRWTIGHGHTRGARAGAEVSESDAEALLIYDLIPITEAIDQAVFTPLTNNQFDALASFVFNIGVEPFQRSAILRRINAGEMVQAAFELEIWRKADFEGERIVVDALVRRRAAEKALFLTPDMGWIAASSARIAPKPDHGLAVGAPEDDDLSPVERAAANLTARLRTLAPDDPSASVVEMVAEPPEETAPFPNADKPAPEPPPEPSPARPPEVSEMDAIALRRTLFGADGPRRRRPRVLDTSLTGLGLAGIAAFVGAVIWAFNARPATGGTAPLNIGVVLLGAAGILCVASAVYIFLERLADGDR